MKCKFKKGDAVVFEPKNLNKSYWNSLSEEDKIKYYGSLGYGSKETKIFVFITKINQCDSHCILISLDDGKIETMRHTNNFRLATEEEL